MSFYQAIQISTLPLYTDEQIFKFVTQNLLRQGVQSRGQYQGQEHDDGCAYRGKEQLRCAAGMLISDSEYRFNMEGEAITRMLFSKFPDVYTLLRNGTTFGLLIALQFEHDNRPARTWKYQFLNIAKQYGFSTEGLE